ncbi:MAG: S-layer homology domain-containing protein [Clostridiales bacterium]|jgi:hypothetical protein|nr:S-layer homology domain-containing protein [Clostridiales bacterium]
MKKLLSAVISIMLLISLITPNIGYAVPNTIAQVGESAPVGATTVLPNNDIPNFADSFNPVNTYYLSPNGDNNNTGSRDNPWKSLVSAGGINGALAKIPTSGNVKIVLLDGTYPSFGFIPNYQFTNPVLIIAENPYKARVADTSTNRQMYLTKCKNMVFNGIEFSGTKGVRSGDYLMQIELSHNITLENCILHDSFNNDILKLNERSANTTIRNCVFYNAPDGGDEHIDANSVYHTTIEGCIFFNDYVASGQEEKNSQSSYVLFKSSSSSPIKAEELEAEGYFTGDKWTCDNWTEDINATLTLGTRAKPSYDVTIDRNVFLNYWGRSDASYIQLGEDNKPFYEVTDSTISNNLFINNRTREYQAGDGNYVNRQAGAITIKCAQDTLIEKNIESGFIQHSWHGYNDTNVGFGYFARLSDEGYGIDGVTIRKNSLCDYSMQMGQVVGGTKTGITNLTVSQNNYYNGGAKVNDFGSSYPLGDYPFQIEPTATFYDPLLQVDLSDVDTPAQIANAAGAWSNLQNMRQNYVSQYGTRRAEDINKHVVIFRAYNRCLIKVEKVANGASSSATSAAALGKKLGTWPMSKADADKYKIIGWTDKIYYPNIENLTIDRSDMLVSTDNISANTIFQAIYASDTSDTTTNDGYYTPPASKTKTPVTKQLTNSQIANAADSFVANNTFTIEPGQVLSNKLNELYASNPEGGFKVVLKEGTYPAFGYINNLRFQNPILIVAEKPYKAKVQDTSTNRQMYITKSQNIIISGIEFSGTKGVTKTGYLTQIELSKNITLENCILHDSYNNDILKLNEKSSNTIIRNCVFYNANAGGDEHIDANSVYHTTIEGCIFFNDYKASQRAEQNTTSPYILFKSSSSGPYTGDKVYDDAQFNNQGRYENGVWICNNWTEDIDSNDRAKPSYDAKIRNNVFMNWWGLPDQSYVLLGEDNKPFYEVQDVEITNNFFLNNKTRSTISNIGNYYNRMSGNITLKNTQNVQITNNVSNGYVQYCWDNHNAGLESFGYFIRFSKEGAIPSLNNITITGNSLADYSGAMGLLSGGIAEMVTNLTFNANNFYNGGKPFANKASYNMILPVTADKNATFADPGFADNLDNVLTPYYNGSSFNGGYSTIQAARRDLITKYGTNANANNNVNTGGGGGGGGGGNTNNDTNNQQETATSNNGQVSIPYQKNEEVAIVNLDNQKTDEIISKALNDVIELDFSDATNINQVEISGATMQKVAESGKKFEVKLENGDVILDNSVLTTAKNKNVTLSIVQKDDTTFEITLKFDDTIVHNLNGNAQVKLPIPFNMSEKEIAVEYTSDSGVKEYFTGEKAPGGFFVFRTPHFSTFKLVDMTLPFADVNKSNWFYDSVGYVYQNGIMQGMEDGMFVPQYNMTRAMFVTTLYRIAGEPDVLYNDYFDDCQQNVWYTNAVKWAANNKIVSGRDDGTFDPNGSISRQEIATILYRYKNSPATKAIVAEFIDSGEIASYARDAIAWAQSAGVITGYEDKSFNPKKPATRAEVAAIISRFNKL